MINQKKDENRILYLMGREKELEYNLELFIRLDSLVIKVKLFHLNIMKEFLL